MMFLAKTYPSGSKMHLAIASWIVTTVAVLTSFLAYVFEN
jgi:hypothetical protein